MDCVFNSCVLYVRVYPWLRPLCYTSLGVFLLGFLLWNIDNIYCDTLRWASSIVHSDFSWCIAQFWHLEVYFLALILKFLYFNSIHTWCELSLCFIRMFCCCFFPLRASRHTLPPVVGVVTQLHAWWHIFTGLGSYLHILLR